MVFVECNTQACGDKTRQASLQGLVSAAVVSWLHEFSPELEAVLVVGTLI